MARRRQYEALAAGAIVTLGLWFVISRFHEFNTLRWHSDAYVAIFHGKLPAVPQYAPGEKPWIPSRSPDGEVSEDIISINAELPAPSALQEGSLLPSPEDAAIPAPTISPNAWNPAWDDRDSWRTWSEPTPTAPLVSELPQPTTHISRAKVQKYVRSILNFHDDTTMNRVRCPREIGARYSQLRDLNSGQIRYFFALDLYQSAGVLSRLMSSIVEAMRFLGPENCAVSVVEGGSSDGTLEILAALKPNIEALEARFFLSTSRTNPSGGEMNRMEALVELRNQVLAPLKIKGMDELAGAFAPDGLIIFIDDIAPCPEDILELVLQHVKQGAHMTCAFDWVSNGTLFHDVWVSRSLVGNTFFEIPHDASWAYSEDMFFDDPDGRRRFDAFQPLQVYSCWGGMVTLDAAPFASETIKFRTSADGECYMGEPTLLGKDLFRQGLGKILAVPAVNVAHSDEEAAGTKQARGYVADHINISGPMMDRAEFVSWQLEPPPMVKCMPYFDQPSWVSPV